MKNLLMLLLLIAIGFGGWKYFLQKPGQQNQPGTQNQSGNKTTHATQNNSPGVDDNSGQTTNRDSPATKEVPMIDRGERTDAIALFQKGRFAEAVALLQKEIANPEQENRQDRNLAYLAQSYEYLGDLAKAEATWNLLLAQFTQSKYLGDAKYFLSQQAQKKGLESSFLKLLTEAAQYGEQCQGSQKAALELGNFYFQKGGDAVFEAWQWYSSAMHGDFPKEIKRSLKKNLDLIVGKIIAAAPSRIPGATAYTVKKGDKLVKIAKHFQSSPGLIRWVNKKQNDMLRIGEQLTIVTGPVWIEVSKGSFFLVVYLEKDLYFRSYEVGLGKDDKTPVGIFTIETRLEKPDWYFNGRRVPYGDPKNVLGTRWMGFDNKPGVTGFGIHGTPEPDSIGKNQSNGCVRMRNEEVEELFEFIPLGTKVLLKEP